MKRFVLLAALWMPGSAEAKDLRKRLGLGMHQQHGDVAAVSLRYGLGMPDAVFSFQGQALLGGDTVSDTYLLGVRGMGAFVVEDNLNLNLVGGVFLRSDAAGGNYVRLQPALAADVFLFGLDNLSLTLEGGLNLEAGSSTVAATFTGLGAHYWF